VTDGCLPPMRLDLQQLKSKLSMASNLSSCRLRTMLLPQGLAARVYHEKYSLGHEDVCAK
jgi:hypothetical protein